MLKMNEGKYRVTRFARNNKSLILIYMVNEIFFCAGGMSDIVVE